MLIKAACGRKGLLWLTFKFIMAGKSQQQELEGTGCLHCNLSQAAESEGSSILASAKLAFSTAVVQDLQPTEWYHTPWEVFPCQLAFTLVPHRHAQRPISLVILVDNIPTRVGNPVSAGLGSGGLMEALAWCE